MRSGFWRESTEANNWGACKTRNPRSACLWPGELAQSAVGANSVASRAYVARLPPRCWSIRGARAAREEARPGVPYRGGGTQRDCVEDCGVSAWRKRRQRWRRLRFTGKRPATVLLERVHVPLAVFAQGLVDRARRLAVAVRRGDQHPAVGAPASALATRERASPPSAGPGAAERLEPAPGVLHAAVPGRG